MAKKNEIAKAASNEVDLYAHANNSVGKSVVDANTKSGGGWAFIKLVQPTTKAQDEVDGLVPGNFLFGRDENLGNEIVAVPVANRARATLWDRDKGEIIEESSDPSSELYASIRGRRGDYGLEFLFWVPLVKQFGVLGFTKPTSRPLGAKVNEAMGAKRMVSITSKMTTNKKGRFAVMLVEAVDAKGKIEMPDAKLFETITKDFLVKEKDAPTNSRER